MTDEKQNAALALAATFRTMAERIEHNADSTFGGAAVIVPPNGGGDVIEVLILDSRGDVAQFWSAILSRGKITLDTLQQQQQVARTFGPR